MTRTLTGLFLAGLLALPAIAQTQEGTPRRVPLRETLAKLNAPLDQEVRTNARDDREHDDDAEERDDRDKRGDKRTRIAPEDMDPPQERAGNPNPPTCNEGDVKYNEKEGMESHPVVNFLVGFRYTDITMTNQTGLRIKEIRTGKGTWLVRNMCPKGIITGHIKWNPYTLRNTTYQKLIAIDEANNVWYGPIILTTDNSQVTWDIGREIQEFSPGQPDASGIMNYPGGMHPGMYPGMHQGRFPIIHPGMYGSYAQFPQMPPCYDLSTCPPPLPYAQQPKWVPNPRLRMGGRWMCGPNGEYNCRTYVRGMYSNRRATVRRTYTTSTYRSGSGMFPRYQPGNTVPFFPATSNYRVVTPPSYSCDGGPCDGIITGPRR